MARPRKQIRRDIRLMARFTEDEAKSITAKAQAAGVSVSDLLRAAALDMPVPKGRRGGRVEDAQSLGAVLGAIGRIGNNINQLAHLAHIGMWPSAPALDAARTDIAWMRYHVMKALGVRDQPEGRESADTDTGRERAAS